MRRIIMLLILAACTAPHDERLTQGAACYDPPYAASIELQTRGQVINWNYGLPIYDAPQGNVIGQLDPGERFRVLDGPVCWHFPQTSNNRQDYRVWQVESETRAASGWIHEYAWGFLTGTLYGIAPLDADAPGILIGQALPAPFSMTDTLPEHEALGEPTFKHHAFTVQDYGYITIAIEPDNAELVNPDVDAGTLPCRVIGLLEPATIPTTIIGNQMEIGSGPVNRVWVEPGDYQIQVNAHYIPRESNEDTTCPASSYTLTIEPVG